MFSTIVDVTKLAVSLTAGAGASKIVHEIVKSNVAEPSSTYESMQMAAGTLALGSLVAYEVREHTNAAIDGLVETVRDFRNKKTEDTPES